MRESLLRVPKQIGAYIGMAGGILLGSAVVEAGIFSSLTLILASLSLITSFIAPDYTIINPMRICAVGLVILAGNFGLLGVVGGFAVIMGKLISSKSFGVPFLAPISPYIRKDALKAIYYSKTDFKTRPKYLNLKDKFFRG
jgi:hypothetical protein